MLNLRSSGQAGPVTFVFFAVLVIIGAAILPVIQTMLNTIIPQFETNDPSRLILGFLPAILIIVIAAYIFASSTGSSSKPNY